jgi:hypothetical protein
MNLYFLNLISSSSQTYDKRREIWLILEQKKETKSKIVWNKIDKDYYFLFLDGNRYKKIEGKHIPIKLDHSTFPYNGLEITRFIFR